MTGTMDELLDAANHPDGGVLSVPRSPIRSRPRCEVTTRSDVPADDRSSPTLGWCRNHRTEPMASPDRLDPFETARCSGLSGDSRTHRPRTGIVDGSGGSGRAGGVVKPLRSSAAFARTRHGRSRFPAFASRGLVISGDTGTGDDGVRRDELRLFGKMPLKLNDDIRSHHAYASTKTYAQFTFEAGGRQSRRRRHTNVEPEGGGTTTER